MIKKIFILFLFSCAVVIVEAAAASFVQTRWLPDLALLTVIFATLSLGFRFGFIAALTTGGLRECLTAQTFGMMLLPCLACVYLADYFKRYLSLQESLISRMGVVAVCAAAQIVIQALFFSAHHPPDLLSAGVSIILPQILVTVIFSEMFFNMCRSCASRSFV